jgi:hypothetical protein
VRQLTIALVVAAMCAVTACKKTGEGEYQVEKPVVGTQTDTVHTPTVDVTKDTVSATVPKVEINKPDTTN